MQDEPVLSWKVAGLLLGLLLIVATAVAKPLGVSSQYVVTDAIVLHSAAPNLAESNEYLSKYGEKQDWGIGYGYMWYTLLKDEGYGRGFFHTGAGVHIWPCFRTSNWFG